MYDLGELWITPDTYTIAYSRKVTKVRRHVPSGKSEIIELTVDVGRIPDPPKSILAICLDAENVTAGDGANMVQFDPSESVNRMADAKMCDADDTTYDRTHDDIGYKIRTGRYTSREKEEARRAKGVERRPETVQEDQAHVEQSQAKGQTQVVKERMDRRMLNTEHGHKKRHKSKSKSAAKAPRAHDQLIHTIALLIAMWAFKTDSLIVLENLRGMFEGWSKQKGKFGRGLRRKLYSATIMKMSDVIWDAARLQGIETVLMNPCHTSKLCAVCRMSLSGDYHRRTCRHCMIGVDRDVNSIEVMWWRTCGEQAPRPVWFGPA